MRQFQTGLLIFTAPVFISLASSSTEETKIMHSTKTTIINVKPAPPESRIGFCEWSQRAREREIEGNTCSTGTSLGNAQSSEPMVSRQMNKRETFVKPGVKPKEYKTGESNGPENDPEMSSDYQLEQDIEVVYLGPDKTVGSRHLAQWNWHL
jgi:hypothetical protein